MDNPPFPAFTVFKYLLQTVKPYLYPFLFLVAVFVFEVCCIAFFSYFVHSFTAYLYLYPFSLRSHYSNMKRLITC